MRQGDILEVSGKVVFESNNETDFNKQPKLGVVRRGFLCTDRAGNALGSVFMDLPEAIGMSMPKGTTHVLTIKRGGLRQGQDASEFGSWFYDLVQQGWAEPGPLVQAAQEAGGVVVGSEANDASTAPTGPPVAIRTTTGDDIIDQVLTKIAKALRIAYPEHDSEWAVRETIALWDGVRFHRHGIPMPTTPDAGEETQGEDEA